MPTPTSVAGPVLQIHDASRVLGEAVTRIAIVWEVSNAHLGLILNLSRPSVSRLRGGSHVLKPGSKPFELAQHLILLFLSLNSWLGHDDAAARSWLATPNLDLGGAPLELIVTTRGLLRIGDYIDALRLRS